MLITTTRPLRALVNTHAHTASITHAARHTSTLLPAAIPSSYSLPTFIMSTDTIAKRLLARDPPVLEPKEVWDPELVEEIAGLDEHRFVKAALHLANDDIERCHLIAQADEGDPTADLLHATLHRREGDYWNSKYWYSSISSHPLLSRSDAKAFVDACAAARGSDDNELRAKQWDELKAIVQWTRENCTK